MFANQSHSNSKALTPLSPQDIEAAYATYLKSISDNAGNTAQNYFLMAQMLYRDKSYLRKSDANKKMIYHYLLAIVRGYTPADDELLLILSQKNIFDFLSDLKLIAELGKKIKRDEPWLNFIEKILNNKKDVITKLTEDLEDGLYAIIFDITTYAASKGKHDAARNLLQALFEIRHPQCTATLPQLNFSVLPESSSLLGSGTFSHVYRDPVKKNSAVKKFHLDINDLDVRHAAIFVNELFMLTLLHNNANLIKVHHFSLSPQASIYMEYAFYGDLMTMARKGLSPTTQLKYAQQLISGLHAMHALGILHRDLKPHNVVITEKGQLKICDMGTATCENNLRSGFKTMLDNVTTPVWAPPEALIASNHKLLNRYHIINTYLQRISWTDPHSPYYSKASDIYSLGLILLALMMHEEPYLENEFNNAPDADFETLVSHICAKGNHAIDENILLSSAPHSPLLNAFSLSYRQLIRSMCDHDPRKRPALPDINNTVTQCINTLPSKK